MLQLAVSYSITLARQGQRLKQKHVSQEQRIAPQKPVFDFRNDGHLIIDSQQTRGRGDTSKILHTNLDAKQENTASGQIANVHADVSSKISCKHGLHQRPFARTKGRLGQRQWTNRHGSQFKPDLYNSSVAKRTALSLVTIAPQAAQVA
jgi:hypothetical protein